MIQNETGILSMFSVCFRQFHYIIFLLTHLWLLR